MTISLCLDLIDVDFLWRRKRASSKTELRSQKNENGLRNKLWQTFRQPRGQKHQPHSGVKDLKYEQTCRDELSSTSLQVS